MKGFVMSAATTSGKRFDRVVTRLFHAAALWRHHTSHPGTAPLISRARYVAVSDSSIVWSTFLPVNKTENSAFRRDVTWVGLF